jgi:hypothetical protein
MNFNLSTPQPTGDNFQDIMSHFPVSTVFNAFTLILCTYGLYRTFQIGKRDKRMPPGPPTLPILGNLHQIPVTGLYKKSETLLSVTVQEMSNKRVTAGSKNGVINTAESTR